MILFHDDDQFRQPYGPGLFWFNAISGKRYTDAQVSSTKCGSSGYAGYVLHGQFIVICPDTWKIIQEKAGGLSLGAIRDKNLNGYHIDELETGSLSLLHELLHAATTYFNDDGGVDFIMGRYTYTKTLVAY